VTRSQLRAELIDIIIKGSARGDGFTVTRREAAIILAELAASDTAPEWNTCRQPGRDILRKVIRIYRAMPAA
jgi:hypothetical protein